MATNPKPRVKSRKLRERATEPKKPGNQARWSIPVYGVVSFTVLAVALAAFSAVLLSRPQIAKRPKRSIAADSQPASREAPRTAFGPRFFQFDKLALMWDEMEPRVRQELKPTSISSNIMPTDYAGSEACAECHKENYADWSEHSHRWMNALADDETVKGDFSETSSMRYRGGLATFFRNGDEFRMRFERDDLEREYLITQTIGSRFYQYYVGVGVLGPEPKEHDYYHVDFVLPFGFWLDRQAWVPVVHIFKESPEGQRWESIEQLKPPDSTESEIKDVGTARGVIDHSQELGVIYSRSCNFCHTTFALGDMMVRNPKRIGPSLPEAAVLEMSDYVDEVHPELWSGSESAELYSTDKLEALIDNFVGFDARDHAATLGVSCEACHLGCLQHAENEKSKPAFTGQNPHLWIFNDSENDTGRSQANINAACGRCHAGNRPTYAGGMSTWNSTEHTDAMRGSCYSQLSCVHCHDPHQAIGKVWRKTPQQDNASCLTCHAEYQQSEVRQLHTRHPAGSSGDRCMNCHMPKINEGMQDVVRTHTIFSPTQPDMIEANQPNACNLCHLEQSINWTLSYLQLWYGRVFNDAQISKSYVDRGAPVGLGWLTQSHEPTRLVAVEAFGEQQASWGLSSVLELLDDPYLMVRQFAQKSVESLTDSQLDQRFGYWYYMTPEEREPLLEKIRRELVVPD